MASPGRLSCDGWPWAEAVLAGALNGLLWSRVPALPVRCSLWAMGSRVKGLTLLVVNAVWRLLVKVRCRVGFRGVWVRLRLLNRIPALRVDGHGREGGLKEGGVWSPRRLTTLGGSRRPAPRLSKPQTHRAPNVSGGEGTTLPLNFQNWAWLRDDQPNPTPL